MSVIKFRKDFAKFMVSIIILMLCLVILYCSPVAVVLTQWLQRYFAPGNGTLWLSDVQCTGHESGLTDCQHSIFHNISGRYGTFTCNHHLEVGAMCFNGSGL